MKVMSKISSKLGVKTLDSPSISLGGGGVFRTPLTSENNRQRTHFYAFYGNPQSNRNLSSFAFIYNSLLLKNNHFSQSGDFSLLGGEK